MIRKMVQPEVTKENKTEIFVANLLKQLSTRLALLLQVKRLFW